MSWKFDNALEFAQRYEQISSSVRGAQVASALEQWKLNKYVNITFMEQEDQMRGYYEYMPQIRNFVSGDPSPATCKSMPSKIQSSSLSEPLSVKIRHIEIADDLCIMSNVSKSLEDTIAEMEFNFALVLGESARHAFFYGGSSVNMHGLLNHPSSVESVSPTGEASTTYFADKTANEIVGELSEAMLGLREPKILISEKAWRDAANKIVGNGDRCNRAGDCILKLLGQDGTINFNPVIGENVFIEKWMDSPSIDGITPVEGAYVVWDATAVEHPLTPFNFIYPEPKMKYIDIIRQVAHVGAIVKYDDSVRIVTGVTKPAE